MIRTIRPEPLTASAFEPFGWLLEPGGTPDFTRPGLEHWRQPFSAASPLRLQIMRYHHQPLHFTKLERHLDVTEARIPASTGRVVLIVAGSTTSHDPDDAPDPNNVRAFVMEGTGIMFKPGVWHGLDCYPLDAKHADFLFLSDEATEIEIEGQPSPVSGRHTHVVDYRERQGLTFEVDI